MALDLVQLHYRHLRAVWFRKLFQHRHPYGGIGSLATERRSEMAKVGFVLGDW